MKSLTLGAITVLAGLTLALAGCGGDDSDDGATPPPTTPSTTLPPSDPSDVSIEGVNGFESPAGGQFTVFARVVSEAVTARTVFVEFVVHDLAGQVIGDDTTTVTVKSGDPQLILGDFFAPEEAELGRIDANITSNTAPVVAVGSAEGQLAVTAGYSKAGLRTSIGGAVSSTRTTFVTEARVTVVCHDAGGQAVAAGEAFVQSVTPATPVPYTIVNPNQRDYSVTVDRCEATATSTLE